MKGDGKCNPPFQVLYRALLESNANEAQSTSAIEECELPVIDLRLLDDDDNNDAGRRKECARKMARASSEWGFFQLMNHGISSSLIARMLRMQVNLFRQPFEKKAGEKLSGFSADSYRWGTPSATCTEQLSWSEAYHLPLVPSTRPAEPNSLRSTVEEFASALAALAEKLATVLSRQIGDDGVYFRRCCTRSTSYLRMNRYPPCPVPARVNGIVPHTDSDFLTILWQDQVGGLQVMKGGRWHAVKPHPEALVVNIGDLFQVRSNGVYRSVEHRVVSHPDRERFSVAYFLCPSGDALMESCGGEAPVYKKFTFREYREKVQEDVRLTGGKVGLSRFLA